MKYFILALFTATLLFSCNSDKKNISSKETKPSVSTSEASLPPVPELFIVKLFKEVDHIDYYFRNTSFSISQDEKAATQRFIALLSPGKAVSTSASCKSPLRMTFLSNGNILAETEMYMTDNCQYVEYYIDGVKTYHSNHSSEGYTFLLNLIKQGESARKGQQG